MVVTMGGKGTTAGNCPVLKRVHAEPWGLQKQFRKREEPHIRIAMHRVIQANGGTRGTSLMVATRDSKEKSALRMASLQNSYMQNIFDSAVRDAHIDRVNKLAPETRPLWGKMNAAQMVAHVNKPYEIICDPDYGTKNKRPN